jgi:TonB-dependent SusC/RagA subfamily outer membrane receptor
MKKMYFTKGLFKKTGLLKILIAMKFTLLLFLCTTAQVFGTTLVAQQNTISGKVTDVGGFPLPGVSIVLKGTTTGTTTNLDGEYNLEIPAQADLLIFSFIGMETQEVNIDGKNLINITLTEATTGLDEVMIVGYGTQSNRKVSAAISQVSTEELEITKRPVPNAQQALIGSIPGLIINQTRGEPGAGVDIFVRETSALASGGRGAMVLIDGFGGSLSDVSPNDIASVTVLKDAAATSIYGARGANGVVLVTTKKPAETNNYL